MKDMAALLKSKKWSVEAVAGETDTWLLIPNKEGADPLYVQKFTPEGSQEMVEVSDRQSDLRGVQSKSLATLKMHALVAWRLRKEGLVVVGNMKPWF